MRVSTKIREHVFTWPLGDSIPENDKVRVVCIVPPRAKQLEATASYSDFETDEKTGKTYNKRDYSNWSAVIRISVQRIENVENEDGSAVDPVRAADKIENYMQQNFGLDEDTHGVFQNEFLEWFDRRINRTRSEEAKKNVTPSPPPATGSGAVSSPNGTEKKTAQSSATPTS